jgi:hypothetical protein
MLKTLKTISAQEAEVLLWRLFSDLREWHSFLADNRRSDPKQNVGGFTLLPCAKVVDGRDKSPRYVLRELDQFIKDVRACTPVVKPGVVTPMTLDIDDALPWKLNAFNRAGKPVLRKCSVFSGAGHRTGEHKPITAPMSCGLYAPYTH